MLSMTAWQVDSRSKRLFLLVGWAVVLLLAVGLRIWMWSFQARSGAVSPGDAEEYYRAAVHLLQGSYYDTGKWLRPPLYPAFLAFWFSLFGVDLSRTLLAQAILSSFVAPACGWLAQRLFSRHSVSLLAGLIAALFIPLASFGSILFAESLFVILIVLALALFDQMIVAGTLRTALLAGLLFGLAALTRAVAISFIPLIVIVLLLAYRTLHMHRQRFRLAAMLILGATLVIGPWALRNAIVHQRLILSDTNGGISMWYGVIRSDAEQQAGEAQLWAIPNPADRQALALRWTLEKIIQDPLWFAGRMRFKIASLYLLQVRSFAVGDSITVDPRDQLVAISAGENPLSWSAIADAQYILMMLAAIAGMCYAPDRRKLLPVLLWVLLITFMSAITIGHPRLRLPIVALLIPCAAYGMALGWGLLRRTQNPEPRTRSVEAQYLAPNQSPNHPITQSPRHHITRSRRRLVVMLAGWLIFSALIFSMRYFTWVRTWPDLRMAHAAMASNEYNAAQTYFEQAQRTDPANALRSIDIADLAFQRGDFITALELYGQALKLEDRNLYAHAMRARIAALLGLRDLAETEQAVLAGYGRDNNEVYDWAWQTFDNPPVARVVPGDPLALGQFAGFAPATPDLPSGRWTLGDARIRLTAGCGQVMLRVRGQPGRSIRIVFEGRDVQQSVLLDGTEQVVRVPIVCADAQAIVVPPTAQSLLVRGNTIERPATIVRIHSSTALLDIETAPWYVGVAVLEVRIDAP